MSTEINPIEVTRNTKETAISLSLNINGTQQLDINTGIGFLDHMIDQLASHGGFALQLQCRGDLEIDDHHTVDGV